MKTYKMSWAAAQEHKPQHPERTAKRDAGGMDFDVIFQVWPNRASMAKSIRMQQDARPGLMRYQTDWRPCVPLKDNE